MKVLSKCSKCWFVLLPVFLVTLVVVIILPFYVHTIKTSKNNENVNKISDYVYVDKNWIRYTNYVYKYSVELPSGWLIAQPSNPHEYIIAQNYFPYDYPLIGEGDKSQRDLPDDYKYIHVGALNGVLKDENGKQVIYQTREENEKKYNSILSLGSSSATLLPETNISINGKDVKGISDWYRNQKYNYYFVPNNDYSLMYVITTLDKAGNNVSEYRHIIESFKIL